MLIYLVGLPASGKSTLAEQLSEQYNASILSSDILRIEMYGNIDDQEHNNEVFTELNKRIISNIQSGNNVIYDATNINYKRRKVFVESLKKYDCEKVCYIVATPYEDCLKYNSLRDRKVPEYVIKKMYLNFYIPQYYEGWDEIKIHYNCDLNQFSLHELFNGKNGLNFINQDNPHHTLTVGNHCLKTNSVVEQLAGYENLELLEAALLHDIGKRFTKEFKNAKGEPTDTAHYYQHHLVSAYDSLFYETDLVDVLKRANLIQWHMRPFNIETDKAKIKFLNLIGQEFYDELMLLHKADITAH